MTSKKLNVMGFYLKTVTVYTDGACSGNPGPGGYGAILIFGQHQKEVSGGATQTTNNRMEISAVIAALLVLNEPCVVELYSDSKYLIDSLSKGWAKSWQKNDWRKADKKPALNADLWEELLALADKHKIICHWVKGHSGNAYNERCDKLAVTQSLRFSGTYYSPN